MRWRCLVIVAVLMQLFSSNFTYAQPSVPNGTLTVAYRQLSDGELSKSVHQLQLSCWDGTCSLTTLTLNQCTDLSDGRFFYPKVERSSTPEGNLSVRLQGDTVLIAEQKHSETTFRYRFEYTIKSDERLQKGLNLRSNKFFGDLTGFSGAAVKNSTILGQGISWDLVPLQGRFPRVKLDCDVTLDGVPERAR
jgi:uncharacterized protein YqiB (DUF1249 family)